MLSERSQEQKVTYCIICFIYMTSTWQNYRDKKYISGCQGLIVGGKFVCKGVVWENFKG